MILTATLSETGEGEGEGLAVSDRFKEGLMRLRTEIRTDVHLGDLKQEQTRRI